MAFAGCKESRVFFNRSLYRRNATIQDTEGSLIERTIVHENIKSVRLCVKLICRLFDRLEGR